MKLFLENKGHGNPRACLCIHAYVHECSRPTCTCFTHAYAFTGMCAHARVPETMKGKFFCIIAKVWNESHIVWELFQTHISHYIKPYMVPFQNT